MLWLRIKARMSGRHTHRETKDIIVKLLKLPVTIGFLAIFPGIRPA